MLSGMRLSRDYYEEYGKDILERRFAPYLDKITVGLVGEGSECFGFDDELSKDHDYGPSFCIWLSEDTYRQIGYHMRLIYESFPKEYKGVAFKLRRKQAMERRGVIETKAFYRRFLGSNVYPKSVEEWLGLPESYLAVATNGEIFWGEDTEFMRIRRHLLKFYPEDVRRKKIAANLIKMAHCGQVNYARMSKRKDAVAARLALDQFMQETIRVVYLLNKKYCPYYKWMWRGLAELPDDYGTGSILKSLAENPIMAKENPYLIEIICRKIREELYRQDMSADLSDYLEDQALSVTERIEDEALRNLPVMMG